MKILSIIDIPNKYNLFIECSKKKPTGDCFESAGKYIIDNGRNGDLILVHGLAIGRGPIAGIKFSHAWIEQGDLVIDVANGRHIELPKNIYYALGNISETFKYTFEDVLKKTLDTGHWGPWDLISEY